MIVAAMGLIAEKGVARTTLADVGVAAGYSRGLPVERFGSKLGLLNAMIDSADAWFAEQAPMQVGSLRGLAAVRARIAAHVEGGLKSPIGARFVHYMYVDAAYGVTELRPRMQALMGAFAAGFQKHLVEARDAGEIAPDADCEKLAAVIVAMVRGVFVEWVLTEGATDLRALSPLMQEMATAAIARAGNAASRCKETPRP